MGRISSFFLEVIIIEPVSYEIKNCLTVILENIFVMFFFFYEKIYIDKKIYS